MPLAFQERFQRLTDGGCPPVEVEMCLSGRCHGEVGAETLAQWKFPAGNYRGRSLAPSPRTLGPSA